MTVDIRTILWSSRKPTRWKNGGGTTYEFAVGPEGADLPSFDWRVSVAEVAVDGPFSVFDGIDRTMVLLEGSGVELVVENRSFLVSASRPLLSFDGGMATTSRLTRGHVRDLNVMTRRGRVRHEVVIRHMGKWTPDTPHWMAFAIDEDGAVTIGDTTTALQRFDLIECRGTVGAVTFEGRFWIITFTHEQGT